MFGFIEEDVLTKDISFEEAKETFEYFTSILLFDSIISLN